MNEIRSIIITGYSLEAYMTALFFQHVLNAVNEKYSITIIGEPNNDVLDSPVSSQQLNIFFRLIGVPENEWMAISDASFSYGRKLTGWRESNDHSFWHLFNRQSTNTGISLGLMHYWLNDYKNDRTDKSYTKSVCSNAYLAENNRAPKPAFSQDKRSDTQFQYGYHLNPKKLKAFLKRRAKQQGIEFVASQGLKINSDDKGKITSVITDNDKTFSGDLYLDCVGKLNSQNNNAFTYLDSASYCNRFSLTIEKYPLDDLYNTKNGGLKPYVNTKLTNEGYQLTIPFVSEKWTYEFYNEKSNTLTSDKVQGVYGEYSPMIKSQFWVENVISLGRASFCLDPIFSFQYDYLLLQLKYLLHCFPDREYNLYLSDQFNKIIKKGVDEIMNFHFLNYALVARKDLQFWKSSNKWKKLKIESDTNYIDFWPIYTEKNLLINLHDHISMYTGVGELPSHSYPLTESHAIQQTIKKFQMIEYLGTQGVKNLDKQSEYFEKLNRMKSFQADTF